MYWIKEIPSCHEAGPMISATRSVMNDTKIKVNFFYLLSISRPVAQLQSCAETGP